MGKDIRRRFTVSLDFDTKQAEQQVQGTVKNLKKILADAGKASDKFKHFQELVDYLKQIDDAMTSLQNKDLELFEKMFGSSGFNLEGQLKQALEGAFGVDSDAMNVLDSLQERIEDAFKNNVSVDKLRTIAKKINDLYKAAGKEIPLNIDEDFTGKGNFEKRIELLRNACDNFASIWEGVGETFQQGFGAGGVTELSENVKKQVDTLKGHIAELQSTKNKLEQTIKDINSINSKTNFGFLDNYKTELTTISVQNLMDEFDVLEEKIKNGDKTSQEYYDNLFRIADIFFTLNKAKIDIDADESLLKLFQKFPGKRDGNLFGDISTYASNQFVINEFKEASNPLDRMIAIDTASVDELIAGNKNIKKSNKEVSASYEDLKQKVQEYFEINLKLNDETLSDNAYDKVYTSRNKIIREIKEFTSKRKQKEAIRDIFNTEPTDPAKLLNDIANILGISDTEDPNIKLQKFLNKASEITSLKNLNGINLDSFINDLQIASQELQDLYAIGLLNEDQLSAAMSAYGNIKAHLDSLQGSSFETRVLDEGKDSTKQKALEEENRRLRQQIDDLSNSSTDKAELDAARAEIVHLTTRLEEAEREGDALYNEARRIEAERAAAQKENKELRRNLESANQKLLEAQNSQFLKTDLGLLSNTKGKTQKSGIEDGEQNSAELLTTIDNVTGAIDKMVEALGKVPGAIQSAITNKSEDLMFLVSNMESLEQYANNLVAHFRELKKIKLDGLNILDGEQVSNDNLVDDRDYQIKVDTMKSNLLQLLDYVSDFNNQKTGEGKYRRQELGAMVLSDGTIPITYGEDGKTNIRRYIEILLSNLTQSAIMGIHSHPWHQSKNNDPYSFDWFSTGDFNSFSFFKNIGSNLNAMIVGNIMRVIDVSKLTKNELSKLSTTYNKVVKEELKKDMDKSPESQKYSRYIRYDEETKSPVIQSLSGIKEAHEVTEIFEQFMYKAFKDGLGLSKADVDNNIFKKYNLTDDVQLTELATILVNLANSSESAVTPTGRLSQIISQLGGNVKNTEAKTLIEAFDRGEIDAARVYNGILGTKPEYAVSKDIMDSLLTIDSRSSDSPIETLLGQIQSTLDNISNTISNIDNNTRQTSVEKINNVIDSVSGATKGIKKESFSTNVTSIFDPNNRSQSKAIEIVDRALLARSEYNSQLKKILKDIQSNGVDTEVVQDVQDLVTLFFQVQTYLEDAIEQTGLYHTTTGENLRYKDARGIFNKKVNSDSTIELNHQDIEEILDSFLSPENTKNILSILSKVKNSLANKKNKRSSVQTEDLQKNSVELNNLEQEASDVANVFIRIENAINGVAEALKPFTDALKTEGTVFQSFATEGTTSLNMLLDKLQEVWDLVEAISKKDFNATFNINQKASGLDQYRQKRDYASSLYSKFEDLAGSMLVLSHDKGQMGTLKELEDFEDIYSKYKKVSLDFMSPAMNKASESIGKLNGKELDEVIPILQKYIEAASQVLNLQNQIKPGVFDVSKYVLQAGTENSTQQNSDLLKTMGGMQNNVPQIANNTAELVKEKDALLEIQAALEQIEVAVQAKTIAFVNEATSVDGVVNKEIESLGRLRQYILELQKIIENSVSQPISQWLSNLETLYTKISKADQKFSSINEDIQKLDSALDVSNNDIKLHSDVKNDDSYALESTLQLVRDILVSIYESILSKDSISELTQPLSDAVKALQDVSAGIIQEQKVKKTDTSIAQARITDRQEYGQIKDIALNSLGDTAVESSVSEMKALANGVVQVSGWFKTAEGAIEGFTVKINEANKANGLVIDSNSKFAKAVRKEAELVSKAARLPVDDEGNPRYLTEEEVRTLAKAEIDKATADGYKATVQAKDSDSITLSLKKEVGGIVEEIFKTIKTNGEEVSRTTITMSNDMLNKIQQNQRIVDKALNDSIISANDPVYKQYMDAKADLNAKNLSYQGKSDLTNDELFVWQQAIELVIRYGSEIDKVAKKKSALNVSVFQSKKGAQLSSFNTELSSLTEKIDFNQFDDNVLDRIVEIQEGIKNAASQDDLTIWRNNWTQLKNEIIATAKTQDLYTNKQSQPKNKSSKKYGESSIIDAMAKYNATRKMVAESNPSGVYLKQAIEEQDDAFQRLIATQREYSKMSMLTDEQKAELKQLKSEFDGAYKAVDKITKKTQELRAKAVDIEFIDEDIDITNYKDRKAALEQFVNTIYQGQAKIVGFNKGFTSLMYTIDNGDSTVTQMTAQFDASGEAIASTADNIKKVGFAAFLDELKAKSRSITSYLLSMTGFQEVWQQIRRGIEYVREIDGALTELKKVTNETDVVYNKFLSSMSKTAGIVGSTVAELTTMSAEWARLGYSIEEAATLAESTAILLNVSEFEDANAASEALISTMQAFQYTADESQHVVDILNEVGEYVARR